MKKQLKKIVFYSGLIGLTTLGLKLYQTNKLNNQFITEVENHKDQDCHDGTVIAHRGFSCSRVDNSLEAIVKSFNSSCVDIVEVDVRLTKDNKLVIIHDSKIDDISNGKGEVKDLTLDELKKYDFYTKKEKLNYYDTLTEYPDGKLTVSRYIKNKNNTSKVITLDDVLKIESKKSLLIDLKFDDEKQLQLINLINEKLVNYNGELKFIIQSSNKEQLDIMKEKYPDFEYQLIINKKNVLNDFDGEYENIAIKYNLVTKKFIDKQLEEGTNISIWVVNDYSKYYNLEKKIGDNIDDISIITDCPDEICYLNNEPKIKKYIK